MNESNKRLAIENNSSKELVIYSEPSPSGYSYLASYTTQVSRRFNLFLQVKKYKGNNQKYHHVILRINDRDFFAGKVTQEGLIVWNNTASLISQVFYPSDKAPQLELTSRIGDKVLTLATMTRDRVPVKPPMSRKDKLKKLDKSNRLKRISR